MGDDLNRLIPVTFLQRKARSVGNYSVEFIFNDVRARLSRKISANIVASHFESTGFFKRLYNCIEARIKQGKVNHITGDVNYLGLFLSPKKTIHTILDCVFLEKTKGIKFKILKYFWLTIPLKRSAYITAISTATKNDILKYQSADPDKIIVIPVAISSKFGYKKKEFNKEKPVLLQIGTAPNKNIPRLIEAIEDITCRLVIIGRKDESISKQLEEKKIDYQYKSGLTDEEMLIEYAQSDIICFASTYEGFGMPILEGQATGRVVVTSDLSSMPEVAGDAACLVDPNSVLSIRAGINKVINEDVYREGLIQKGFENIKRYNPDLIADQYFQLYQKIYKPN